MITRTAIFVIALLAVCRGHCETLPEKLSMPRGTAVAMALLKNLDLRNEAFNTSMAGNDAARSRSIYDPFFSLSANGGVTAIPGDPFFRTKNATFALGLTQFLPTGGSVTFSPQTGYTNADIATGTSTTDWQTAVGISVAQPLLRNAGKETTEVNITLTARAQQDALERYRAVAIDTVFSAIASYNRLYTLRQVEESKAEALKAAQNLLEELKSRTKQGPHHEMEIANAEYAIVQRRKDLVEAGRNVSDQEAGLRYLIGMETKHQIVPVDPPSRTEPEESEIQAVKKALETRPDLKQLRSTLQASELQERVARHQSLPDLFLTASGGFTGTGGTIGDSFRQLTERPGTYWTAGMQFSVPIGNTALENDYLKSKIRAEQLHTQLASYEWRVRNEVEADMRALISARLQMQMADRAREYGEQRLEQYRKNNRAGTSTVQDVINAENDLTSARNAQLEAVESFAYTVTKLWRDTGELLDQESVHINANEPSSPAAVKKEESPAP